MLAFLHEKVIELTESELNAEGNNYYNVKKCGIGWHGDTERRKVVGVRVGASMLLCYEWYEMGMPMNERFEILLNDGDLYIMGEKAVGTDWQKKSLPTLRHSAGCPKYTNTKKVK